MVDTIHQWVNDALADEDISNYTVNLQGHSNKAEGFLSTINYVTVTGKNKSGITVILDLVIKSSTENKVLKEQIPVDEYFQKEIFIYHKVIPAFREYQEEKTGDKVLDFVAKAYVPRTSTKIVVLENLKLQEYGLCNRQIPMSFDHLKLVLEACGKWHAFSFALKIDRPEIFNQLIANNINLFSHFITKSNVIPLFMSLFEDVKNNTTIQEEAQRHFHLTRKDFEQSLVNNFFEDPAHQVILHGDCWSTNFMFKLKDNVPWKVIMLDWQMSGLASPIMDLSFLIYCCCDTDAYKDVTPILKVYHESLGNSLKKFGVDVGKVFPLDLLLKHWKRFSTYGLILSCFFLKLMLCETEEAPDFVKTAEEGKEWLTNFEFEVKNKDEYYRRAGANFRHYVNNLK